MQDKQDLHLVYNGSDNQVVQFNKQQTGLERIFASEMTHDIHFCRLIRKLETVTIYGKNKKEGDFKLIIQPAKTKKTDNGSILTTQHVLEPPSVWVGNPHRGIFTFMMKLEKDTLLMKLDDDTNWFTVLYFPTSVDYYNVRMTLCRTIRSVFIITKFDKNEPPKIYDPDFPKLYDSKKLTNDCSCGAVTV